LRSVTFAGNQAQAPYAAAIHSATDAVASSVVTVDNAIFWDAAGQREIGFETTSGTVVVSDAAMRAGCPNAAQITCHNVISTDPLLGVLQDNGGATPTTLPGPGSSAVDAGDPATCGSAPFDIDQRGVSRPQGAGCDLGAVELRQTKLTVAVSGRVRSRPTPAHRALRPAASPTAASTAARAAPATRPNRSRRVRCSILPPMHMRISSPSPTPAALAAHRPAC
jgi:hypothetical protein